MRQKLPREAAMNRNNSRFSTFSIKGEIKYGRGFIEYSAPPCIQV
jgi:hypothetical protein